jgi:hypothetical protein
LTSGKRWSFATLPVPQCRRLQAEMVKVKGERDQYLKSLYSLTRKPDSFDADELASMEKNHVQVDQLIKELELEKGA